MIWDGLVREQQARVYDELKRFFSPIVSEQLVRAEARGVENLPASGAALIVANHRTLTDPLLIAQHCPRQVHTVAAGFFGLMPIVAPMLHATGQIVLPVAGGSRSAALQREARRHLEAGRIVVVFPEGVDNFVNGTPEGTISPFHTTFARLVLDLALPGLPVIPVGIQGEEEFAFLQYPSLLMRMIDPGNQAWVDGTVRGTVHRGAASIAFGSPMTFEADYGLAGPEREQAVRRITARVEAAVRRLAAPAEPAQFHNFELRSEAPRSEQVPAAS